MLKSGSPPQHSFPEGLDSRQKFTKLCLQRGNYGWDVIVVGDLNQVQEKLNINTKKKPQRDVKMFVNHWDVCLSSKSCERIMKKKGTSVHFCIDNDGTIYQLLDTQHAAWQAGTRVTNLASVGVEISNAYYKKYNKT